MEHRNTRISPQQPNRRMDLTGASGRARLRRQVMRDVRPHMTTPLPEQLALEIEDLIRTMPGPRDFSANPDTCIPWLGRASAAVPSPGVDRQRG